MTWEVKFIGWNSQSLVENKAHLKDAELKSALAIALDFAIDGMNVRQGYAGGSFQNKNYVYNTNGFWFDFCNNRVWNTENKRIHAACCCEGIDCNCKQTYKIYMQVPKVYDGQSSGVGRWRITLSAKLRR